MIRQAEMLKELGVKPSKALPAQLIDSAAEEPIATFTQDANAAKSISDSESSQEVEGTDK